jgi:ketol-acid reductoisomerase
MTNILRRFALKKNNLARTLYHMETLKLNNKTENIIIGGKDKYHLLEKGFEGINQIGIIGWGSQAPSQYQNINDSLRSINSNITLKVGLRENSKSYNNVLNTKGVNECNIGEMYEVLEESDMNILLISDASQCQNYEKIFEKLKPGSTLGLSHGFLLGHLKNENKYFPEDINVIMMAPKGMGPSLRKLYLQDSGINSSIAIEQDIDNRATDRAISWGIAVGSPYIFETTMEREYVSDLFGERAILLGGIHGIVEYLYKELIKIHPKDKAFIMSCKNLTSLINAKISKKGLLGVFDSLSYGGKLLFTDQYEKSYGIFRELFEEIYEEVESGNEIRSVINYGDKEMSKIDNGEMWQIGRKLQKKNYEDYLNKDKISFSLDVHLQDDYYYMYHIYPRTAGLYIAGMMAQIDILLEKGHLNSEIVNESVIEATDSLNPYMDEKGIAHMIDNCSTTARLGARKWAPRLETLLEKNMDVGKKTTNIKNFINHDIHNVIEELYKYK